MPYRLHRFAEHDWALNREKASFAEGKVEAYVGPKELGRPMS